MYYIRPMTVKSVRMDADDEQTLARIRKRDLISLLTRPVTRLPRLLIQLDAVQKHTLPDHPDQETLPLIRGLLNDYIKSSQPGIEAAESKVKFWELCESLSYQKGEIIVRRLDRVTSAVCWDA